MLAKKPTRERDLRRAITSIRLHMYTKVYNTTYYMLEHRHREIGSTGLPSKLPIELGMNIRGIVLQDKHKHVHTVVGRAECKKDWNIFNACQ